MSKLFYTLTFILGLSASWVAFGQTTPKIFEIAWEEQKIDVTELKYFIEPASQPFDLARFRHFSEWKFSNDGRYLPFYEVKNKRLVMSFDIQNEHPQLVYFRNLAADPLNVKQFVVFDASGSVVETKVVQDHLILVSVFLQKGLYKILFIAEPGMFSGSALHFYIFNSTYFSQDFLKESKISLFIYGIGIAFIFFNGCMFLLHKRPYFIYYVCYSLTILYLLAVGTGDIPMGFGILWNLTIFANCLFTILMSSAVLRLREFYPTLLRITFVLWGIASVFIAAFYIFESLQFWYGAMVFGMTCYFLCMYGAVRRMLAGYIPATFFAMGWGVLTLGYALNLVSMYFISIPALLWSAYVAYALESMLFAVALAYRTRDSEQRAVQDKLHALSQLQKVIYPHQMNQITAGVELEATMPTNPSHACVLSFDIIGSSKIKHIKAKFFYRNVFTRCNAIMSEGYDGKHLKSKAYRIKEIGDGFLCSIGYPFQSISDNSANDAVDLAKRFIEVLREESEILHAATPISCGIGIALDSLTGFYPEAGTKEYDLFGPALVLANRYQGMRKTLFQAERGRSILIIQELVYLSLDPSHRQGFSAMELKENGIVVRDDPAATKLYYQFIGEQSKSTDETGSDRDAS